MNVKVERLARRAFEAFVRGGNWSDLDWESKNRWRDVADAVVAEDRILLAEEVEKRKVAS